MWQQLQFKASCKEQCSVILISVGTRTWHKCQSL